MEGFTRQRCQRRFVLLLFFLAAPGQAIHFPNVWARMETHETQAQGDRKAFVNPQAEGQQGDTSTAHDSQSDNPPLTPSQTQTPSSFSTPDANGALLISMLVEKARAMIYNHLQMQRRTYEKIFSIIMYKPPIGMVTIYSVLELILTKRVFRVYPDRQEEAHGQARRRRKRKRNRGRAYSLEERDQSYVSSGAIERVRGRLCVAVLADMVQEQEAVNPLFAADRSALFFQKRRHLSHHMNYNRFAFPWTLATALDALQISCPPGGSRFDYVTQLSKPLAILRAAQVQQQQSMNFTPKRNEAPKLDVLQVATRLVDLRATDALLRECRDQLLKTSYRLARAVKYWNRRVEQAKSMAVVQQKLIRETIEGDRLRLSYVEAALEGELERLGRICEVLLMEKQPHLTSTCSTITGRPTEMRDSLLLEALKKSGCEACGGIKHTFPHANMGNTTQEKKKWRSTWRLPKLSRYTVRIERGWLKVGHLNKDTFVGGPSAMLVLMEDEHLSEWYADAGAWIHNAKRTLCDVLEETLEASVPEGNHHTSSPADDMDSIRDVWEPGASSASQTSDGSDTDMITLTAYNSTKHAWSRALHVVEDVKVLRRVGEGRTLGFRDLSIVGWLSGFDWFGVPSVLVRIYIAHRLHAWLAPLWPTIRAFVREAWRTIVSIFLTRFWEPGRDVLLDILGRSSRSSMLDGFTLEMEEDSLGRMLKELNFGDGTAATRGQALEAATLKYEEDFKKGLFAQLATGELVRLLLIQMQQVKVGMLQAVYDIDVLIQANKLNMRILAIVPAVFLVTVASRTFLRHLYNFRSRDLRPIHKVHEEMTEHLHRMQSILLQAKDVRNEEDYATGERAQLRSALGELAVRMHCYLVLLDYCSPSPFPKKQCDSLHQSLREVLGSIDMEPSEQVAPLTTPVALLDLVMRKNRSLQKYL